MRGVGRFEFVSKEAYVQQFVEKGGSAKRGAEAYFEIRKPWRATSGSAGYDFVSPVRIELKPGESVEILTGIRAKINEGWVLLIFPRSGLGFKYQTRLANTIGIIDSDYYYAKNEGHIIVKIVNGSLTGEILSLGKGERFAQGVFVPFGVIEGDDAEGKRDGGFGSTRKILLLESRVKRKNAVI